jgi:Xaa-Pro aminopeptidase
MNTIITGRIDNLRQKMAADGISATIIPQTDPHQSEYIAEHWEVRRFLTGFTGSAGTLVVTEEQALLWTDSRYFIQAAEQLHDTGIILMKDGLQETPSIEDWLSHNISSGSTVGIDGMVFSLTNTEELRKTLQAHGIYLNTSFTPIDEIWPGRPTLPSDPVFIHEDKYAGEDATSKIARVLNKATEYGANAIFISALDEIAWVLNIRSSDVPSNPVATAFLLLSAERKTIFISEDKLDDYTREHFEKADIDVLPYDEVSRFLALLPTGMKVLIEPGRTAGTLADIIGQHAVKATSPIALFKATKNDVQIKGTRDAMERDGAALVRTFISIEKALANGETITEIDVDTIATKYRSAQSLYFDNSFATIAGYGPHGAIVHYSATPESASTLKPEGLLLVDSGAQYLDGTTDITRTICLGTPTDLERHDFTLVMKGHIALARSIFPAGTRGDQLDAIARQFLWHEGLSYLHGTGHGVGHFLNVHEGPQSIRLNHVPVALVPGMITSDEPGLYREGIHGIRCENLVLTVPAMATEFGQFYRFEVLTLFPFDLKLFDTGLMTDDEIDWLNSYHAEVRSRLLPHLGTDEEREWLTNHTQPLTR